MKTWRILYYDAFKHIGTTTDVKGWLMEGTTESIKNFYQFFTRNWPQYNVFAEEWEHE